MGLLWILKEHYLMFVLVYIMLISMTKSMSGDNVCHRLENYTVTVRKQYREPVVVQTFTWCISMPPRCAKSHTEMRIRYRTKTELKQRNVSECCKGFINQRLSVGDQFVDECVRVSNCDAGYIGNDCHTECPVGTWGISCMQTCDCAVHAVCNSINGSCNCRPGWHGTQCEDKCNYGKWGLNCTNSCSCINIFDHCHHVTGDCMPDKNAPIDKLPPSMMSNVSTDGTLEVLSPSHPQIYSTDATSADSIQSKNVNRLTFNIDDKMKDNYFTSTITRKIDTSRPDMVYKKITPNITMETASINVPIDDYEYKNREKLFVPERENLTSHRPLVAVIHLSGELNTSQENLIVTPIDNSDHDREKKPKHLPLSSDIVVLVVIGSIISMGVTILALFAIFHARSRLYDTIRLAIYDAEKPDTQDKKNDAKILTLNNELLTGTSCDYETPKSIVPGQRDTTLLRHSNLQTCESTYSNQYPHIQLFSNLQELIEANYDRPPASAFHRSTIDTHTEHLYDEIPLQSTTLVAKTQEETLQ